MYRIITVLAITLGALGLFDGSALTVRRAYAQTSAAAPASPAAASAPPAGTAAGSAPEAPSDEAKAVALKAYQRGTAFYKSEEYDKAIEQFESGYAAVPQAVFIYNIAQSHRLAGRAERALAAYRQYLQLSPDAKNRPEIEERITALEKQTGPLLVVPSVVPTSEPPPAGALLLEPDKPDAKQAAARRRRTTGIVLGVIGGVLVVGAAVGLGLYFGLPRSPEVTVFQPVTP